MLRNFVVLLLLCLPWAGAAAEQGAELSSSLFRLDLMQAREGNVEAQYSLATRYEEGHGVERNLEQAAVWYRRAADQGHAPSHFKLGQLHEEGRGLPQDSRQALIWYTSAAELGDRNASERLRAIVAEKQERARAQALAQRAAEQERREALARQRAEEKARAQNAASQRAAVKPVAVPAPPPAPARAAPKPGFPNLREDILRAKWSLAGHAAEHLPSALTSCLPTGKDEVVCFSRETSRNLGPAELTYSVKATLSGFAPDGSFDISYLFNVTRLKGHAEGAGAADGLRAKEGWQEPALRLRCQAETRSRIRCRGLDGRPLSFVAGN